jgi:hypothetical protein
MSQPVIFEGTRLTIPMPLVERLRRAVRNGKPRDGLVKFDRETWVSAGPVALHEDDTSIGLTVYGVVLVNDARLLLAYADQVYDAPPGTLYRINGRIPHGALAYKNEGTTAPFAFLAWDMDNQYSIHRFAAEAIVAIAAKARGEAPAR